MDQNGLVAPYVGARPFDDNEEDKLRFFGRNDEIKTLISLTIAHPALLIYSASGAGKTSLLNAGLIPALRQRNFQVWRSARFSAPPTQSQSNNLVRTFNPYIYNLLSWWEDIPPVDATLDAYLKSRRSSISKGQPRVLILDQFEELFTVHPESWKKQAEVFQQISDALENDRKLRILIAMREDRIADLDPFLSQLKDNLDTRYHLQPLGRDAALLAIRNPLSLFEYHFAEGVAEGIVEQLLQNRVAAGPIAGKYVEPVQLQVVCESIWQKRPLQSREITVSSSFLSSDIDLALIEFYEKALAQTEQETRFRQNKLRNWFESTLITPYHTRSIVYATLPEAPLKILEDHHIVRREERGGVSFFELTHDRFILPILQSNRINRQNRTRRRLLLSALALVICITMLLSGVVLSLNRLPNAPLNLASYDIGVAVAYFDLGEAVSNTIADSAIERASVDLEAIFTAMSLHGEDPTSTSTPESNPSVGILGANVIGRISGDDSSDRNIEAREIASYYNADLVIYGTVENNPITEDIQIRPSFYVNSNDFETAADLFGSFRLGSAIRTSNDTFSMLDGAIILTNKIQIAVLTVTALNYFNTENYDQALEFFNRALTVAELSSSDGTDVLRILIGNTLLKKSDLEFGAISCNRENVLAWIELADQNYRQALAINPEYARGYTGLANVAYRRATLPSTSDDCFDNGVIDVDQLTLAAQTIDQAASALFQPGELTIQLEYDITKARILYLNLLTERDNNSEIYNELQEITSKIIAYAQAITSSTLKSIVSDAYRLRGNAEIVMNDCLAAIRDLEAELILGVLSRPGILENYANQQYCYEQLQQYDKALQRGEMGLEIAMQLDYNDYIMHFEHTIQENSLALDR